MDTLKYIINKYNLDTNKNSPIEIPNIGRNDLAALFYELGFTTGAEIGIEKGVYSKTLCEANPDLHLYCIDSWQAYSQYRDYIKNQVFNHLIDYTKQNLLGHNVTLIKQFSVDASRLFEDESLDFVYIDANHALMYVVQDIYYWSKKIKKGGIIAGHDYVKRKNPKFDVHVVQAVEAYTSAYHIKPWFVLGTKERLKGQIRDTPRSWMFVKSG